MREPYIGEPVEQLHGLILEHRKGGLMKTLTLILTILAVMVLSVVQAHAVQITFDPPELNTDNTPYTDPQGYKVYEHIGDQYAPVGDIYPHTSNSIQFTATPSTHCYVVTAINVGNRESDYSNEECISLTKPMPVTITIVPED